MAENSEPSNELENDPDDVDAEHDDELSQAQTIADEALDEPSSGFGLSDTEKVKGGIEDEDDVQDLVDHMIQMETSGRIDMSAYRGERSDDDEDGMFGPDSDED